MLRLIDASTTAYKELASAQGLNGHDVWGPMTLSDGQAHRHMGRAPGLLLLCAMPLDG